MTETGKRVCESLSVDVSNIVPRQLSHFEKQDADMDVANLHFSHYGKRRVKMLLRIADCISTQNAMDSYASMLHHRSAQSVVGKVENNRFQTVSADERHKRVLSSINF